MPTYQYNCTGCGTSHDEFRAISKRDDLSVCPDCGGLAEYAFVPTSQIQIKGLLYLGGATTRDFRAAKVAEAKQLAHQQRTMSTAEKASIAAYAKGDYTYGQRRQAALDAASNDLVKFADENKRELEKAKQKNKGTVLNPV